LASWPSWPAARSLWPEPPSRACRPRAGLPWLRPYTAMQRRTQLRLCWVNVCCCWASESQSRMLALVNGERGLAASVAANPALLRLTVCVYTLAGCTARARHELAHSPECNPFAAAAVAVPHNQQAQQPLSATNRHGQLGAAALAQVRLAGSRCGRGLPSSCPALCANRPYIRKQLSSKGRLRGRDVARQQEARRGEAARLQGCRIFGRVRGGL
jgi:hypothetical protein